MGDWHTFVTDSHVTGDDKKDVWIPSSDDIKKMNDRISQLSGDIHSLRQEIDTKNQNIHAEIGPKLKDCSERLETLQEELKQLKDNLGQILEKSLRESIQGTIGKHYELLKTFCEHFKTPESIIQLNTSIEKLAEEQQKSIDLKRRFQWILMGVGANIIISFFLFFLIIVLFVVKS